MPDTFPDIEPSYGSEPNNRFRTLQAQFGDGYTQRAVDGLNAEDLIWSVLWENLENSLATQIRDFLRDKKGVEAFYWTPPNDTQQLFICKEYAGPIPRGYANSTIRATFEKVNDIA